VVIEERSAVSSRDDLMPMLPSTIFALCCRTSDLKCVSEEVTTSSDDAGWKRRSIFSGTTTKPNPTR